ncbi:sigma-70 family RNA polymerase sigma factor [Thalassospira sp.]|uniref:RNA polymerase sigma factor n=1 Tax=Thalassospira sp. TaxID=1912094 RepID=UPI000C5B5775|nr:sigma-70 family RNA polymerase sigma factor [Thalassospira sp.]MBC05442.1 RNA polymerase subunit sigma [Thalassospira sp.]|tara:strand:+ start:4238 stop:4816 length:579 start_codon:yes stop_codon:yes gene_type:complete
MKAEQHLDVAEDSARDRVEVVSEETFISCVQDCRASLYHFVLKHIGNPTDAQDLTQQALTEAYRSLAKFKGESELATWLFGIAMNIVRNFIQRSPHKKYNFVSEDALTYHPHESVGQDEQIAFEKVMRDLDAELKNLPDELRNMIMMVAVDGLTYDEVATMLSVPIGTVRSRLSRVRATLKEKMPEIDDLLS